MTQLLFMAALVGYIGTAGVRIIGARSVTLGRLADVCLWIGLLAHFAGLGHIAMEARALPVHTTAASVAFVGSVVGLGAGVTRLAARNTVLSGVVVAMAAVTLGVSMLLPQQTPPEPTALATFWLPFHVLGIFFGMASFACAFAVSGTFLVVRKRLKAKDFAALGRLPSLDGLDKWNTRFVVIGFLTLTIGIATGGAWAAARGGGSGLGPTVWITLVLWGWYAIAVLVRVVGQWRGRMAALFSVVGFSGLVVSLSLVLLLLQGWHG